MWEGDISESGRLVAATLESPELKGIHFSPLSSAVMRKANELVHRWFWSGPDRCLAVVVWSVVDVWLHRSMCCGLVSLYWFWSLSGRMWRDKEPEGDFCAASSALRLICKFSSARQLCILLFALTSNAKASVVFTWSHFKVCCSPGALYMPVSVRLRARLFSHCALIQVSRDGKKAVYTPSKIAGLWWNLEVLLVEEACFPDPSQWRRAQPFLSIFGFTDTVQNLVWFTALGFVPQEILQMALCVACKLIWYLVCLVLTNLVPALRKRDSKSWFYCHVAVVICSWCCVLLNAEVVTHSLVFNI